MIMAKMSTFVFFLLPLALLAFSGCIMDGGTQGEGKSCAMFGAPPKITGVAFCGTADAPAVVAAGAQAEYAWDASSCYDHFTFQLRRGADWSSAANIAEAEGIRGKSYPAVFPSEKGVYMWNIQGFDGEQDTEPSTAIYPPCYFKTS